MSLNCCRNEQDNLVNPNQLEPRYNIDYHPGQMMNPHADITKIHSLTGWQT